MILNDEFVNNSWGGVELTFVGFGDTYDGANDAGDKRETTIPLYAYDNQFVYSYAPDTNVCQGDSGGAAMEINKDGDYELVGVNSFVSPSCVNGENGAARVDKYIPWIQGYVPDVHLGSWEGDTDTDTDSDADTDTDVDTDSDVDQNLETDAPNGWGESWSAPAPPDDKKYPVGIRCATGPGTSATFGVVTLLILGMTRRRRND
jgi:hypothetical protein